MPVRPRGSGNNGNLQSLNGRVCSQRQKGWGQPIFRERPAPLPAALTGESSGFRESYSGRFRNLVVREDKDRQRGLSTLWQSSVSTPWQQASRSRLNERRPERWPWNGECPGCGQRKTVVVGQMQGRPTGWFPAETVE